MDWLELRAKKGIRLDIGCGENKQPNFLGMDVRDLPTVDIVHNIEEFPWPLSDESCVVIVCSHLVEHIKPWFSVPFMDECWRLLEVGSTLAISTPYAGSRGFWQDPTHCNGWNEATWQYFDPQYPLYSIYKPKPWKVEKGFPVWQPQGNLEVLMIKRSLENAEAAKDLASNTLGISVVDTAKTLDKMGG